MLEAQSVGTLVLSAETEDILLINHMALELFGFSDKDRSGLKIEDIRSHFDDDENAYIKEQLDKVRSTNREIIFEEKVNQQKDRKLKLLAQAKGVILSNGNRVIILTLTDVTYQENNDQ